MARARGRRRLWVGVACASVLVLVLVGTVNAHAARGPLQAIREAVGGHRHGPTKVSIHDGHTNEDYDYDDEPDSYYGSGGSGQGGRTLLVSGPARIMLQSSQNTGLTVASWDCQGHPGTARNGAMGQQGVAVDDGAVPYGP